MQNTVQRAEAVRFWSGVLSISQDNGATWINLGAITEAKLTIAKTIKERVFDNAKMPPKVKINEAIMGAILHEIALDNLQAIDWFATYSTVDGTPVAITGEALWTGWVVGEPIKLANSNGDNTIVTSIVIDADTVALIDGTDYEAYEFGGDTYILPLTAQTGVLDADYSYTPLARKEQLFEDIEKYLALNRFKFVNTDENGKEFGIEFYEWYNRADAEVTFQPDEGEENASLWIEIKAFPSATNQLFRIFDEQDVA